MLCCLRRIPSHMDEIARIAAYHGALSAHERKYFPQSMLRLLQSWEEQLDRATVAMSAANEPKKLTAAERISHEGERKRIAARLLAIAGQGSRDAWGIMYSKKQKEERKTLIARDGMLKQLLGAVI